MPEQDFSWARSAAPLVLAILLLSAPVLALSAAAQQRQPPSRIGNRWDSLSHQPTQADVGAAEQEHGLAPSAQRERAIDSEIDQLGRQLLDQERTDPALNRR